MFQNTPFATAKQAEDEFQKIFQAKSGNVWSERGRFEAKPKRYRLVDIGQVKRNIVNVSQMGCNGTFAPQT
jgi:hypothetical protein